MIVFGNRLCQGVECGLKGIQTCAAIVQVIAWNACPKGMLVYLAAVTSHA